MSLWRNFTKRFQHIKTRAKYRASVVMSYPKSWLGFMMCSTMVVVYFIRVDKDQDYGRNLLSKQVGMLAEQRIPVFMRKYLFGYYARRYGVNLEEVELPLNDYSTFSEFFTRKISRQLPPFQSNTVSSPCDGKVLSVQEVTDNTCQIIKGHTYQLSQLLLGIEESVIGEPVTNILKRQAGNKIYQVIIYLGPGDYHRFHSPTDIQVLKRKDIDGYHYPVNESSITSGKKVYEKNARISLFTQWKQGLLAMVMVGALNVSRIKVLDKKQFQRGEQLGYFNLGSTIVMLIEAKKIKQWRIAQGSRVKYGQPLFQYE